MLELDDNFHSFLVFNIIFILLKEKVAFYEAPTKTTTVKSSSLSKKYIVFSQFDNQYKE